MFLESPDRYEMMLVKNLLWENGSAVVKRYVSPLRIGQPWLIQVSKRSDDQPPKVLEIVASCNQASRSAVRGLAHHHDERCNLLPLYGSEGSYRQRWWAYQDLADALASALRWDPPEQSEPFGWLHSYDGRIREAGRPENEQSLVALTEGEMREVKDLAPWWQSISRANR